ncbi:MAG: hypothetical protein OEP52_08360, partial [Acidimicrobiia bacterium]|nr:hypothetical protein [Acidimicrobiia bacterium]
KRYLADGLYQRGGFYKGVNLIGLATLVGSFGLQQWIKPVGPELWLDAAVDLVPGMGTWSAEYGVPAVLLSMVVAFGLYAVMGRWWIAEWESVARLRI